MALEDLTGVKYIDDLNEAWPLGTDFREEGDDHIRGIKNVLKRTFPNLTGPVTLTQTAINTGSVPAGSILVFLQAAAPTGWTRLPGLTDTSMLRVVKTVDAGGTIGGTDDPVLNDKTPTHVHAVSLTSGNDTPGHVHLVSGYTDVQGNHFHLIPGPGASSLFAPGAVGAPTGSSVAGAHGHAVSFNSQAPNVAHKHPVSGNTAAPAGAANWEPRYIDSIACVKD